MEEPHKKLEDDIPSRYMERFGSISKESWKHEDFRKKIIEICNEQHGTHDFVKKIEGIFEDSFKKESFINKVKTISREEVKSYVDKSRIKTIFWIIGLIVAAGVGLFVQKFGKVF